MAPGEARQQGQQVARVIENIPNPQHYIRQTDGLMRIRIQTIRAAWRGPFQKWIDHVEVTVWE